MFFQSSKVKWVVMAMSLIFFPFFVEANTNEPRQKTPEFISGNILAVGNLNNGVVKIPTIEVGVFIDADNFPEFFTSFSDIRSFAAPYIQSVSSKNSEKDADKSDESNGYLGFYAWLLMIPALWIILFGKNSET
jgi:hypothetical protein